MPKAKHRLISRARFWLQDRVNFARARSAGLQDLSEVDPDIHDLADFQIGHWANTSFARETLSQAFDDLNQRHRSVFIFDIRGGLVSARPKEVVLPANEPARVAHMRQFFIRAQRYRALLQFVLRAYRMKLDTSLAVDVTEYPEGESTLPVFAFQNTAHSRAILLPDVDFFGWNWYIGQVDRLSYDGKEIRAVFAGSSSGAMHADTASILKPTNPRLIAASYFAGHPNIDFRISRAVQCGSGAVKALLERQPYFRPELSWPEQWRNRFLISLDGNGATCSRVALGLKSNSALIKFASPFTLFYFGKLTEGRDFIGVTREQEVEAVVEQELGRPGYYRDIAEAGRHFYERFLERRQVIAYTALLLRAYDAMLRT